MGSTTEDSESDDDLVTVPDVDSEAEAMENDHKVVMSDEELIVSSDSDSEDGNALMRDQLLIVHEKLDKDKRHGSGRGDASDKRDTWHDSGCRETSDGGTANITPLLGEGQTWSIPRYQARPLDHVAYLTVLEELADEQMVAATQLDQNFAYTSIS